MKKELCVRLEFVDGDLQRLYVDAAFRLPWMGSDLIRHYRAKVLLIDNAHDERDLRAMRSLRLEQLKGDRAGQSSIRLNDQWRLILRFRTDPDGRVAVIVDLDDYH